MSTDNKRAPQDFDDEDDDSESHAADEPTAVWDESAMRAAGLTDLLKKRDSSPPSAPATPAGRSGGDPSIVIDQGLASVPARAPDSAPLPAARASNQGLGWGATLVVAVVVGAIVYLVIRLVKG